MAQPYPISKSSHEGFKLYLLMTAIALASFLISLDGFIVNVAIPSISSELGEPKDVGTWMITLFTIASTACVPLSGMLSLRYGNFRVFIVGIIFFAAASFFTGSAPTFNLVLVGRVLQGCAAGLLTPVSLALILNHFPDDKKSIGIGFWSFFVMVGPAMGPMIGGWLSDYHWPWMFYLNLPIAAFSALTVWFFLKDQEEKIHPIPFDIVGMVLLFACVGTLQSALNRWNIDNWFQSPFIVTLFIISGLSLIFLIIWELYHPFPFIDLKLFKTRNFALPSIVTGIGMAILFSSFVLDSLWVQEVLGYTPAWAGLTLAPVGLFPLIFYPLMGRFISILDLRLWIILSFLLYAATFYWLSQINIHSTFWDLALPRLVQGIGFAFFTVPNAVLVVKGIAASKVASIASVFSFTRMLFVGFGVALSITLWIFRETFYQTRLTAKTFASNPLLENLKAPFELVTQSEPKSTALVYQLIKDQSSTLALADIYYLFFWMFIGLCFVVLFYKTEKS